MVSVTQDTFSGNREIKENTPKFCKLQFHFFCLGILTIFKQLIMKCTHTLMVSHLITPILVALEDAKTFLGRMKENDEYIASTFKPINE